MKNSEHHLNHLIQKNVKKNSRLSDLSLQSHRESTFMQMYNTYWGELHAKSLKKIKKELHSYIQHLIHHPSSFSPKHSKRSAPGTVDPDMPHSHVQNKSHKWEQQHQNQICDSAKKLTKKHLKHSKAGWKQR